MGIVNQSTDQTRANLLYHFEMSNQHYAAFIKLTKQDVVECKKMPKPLAECFPTAKVASIATRAWTGKLKLKKRQSTDKLDCETKRSKSSVDFDDVAKVESTKVDQDKATKEQANATA